MWNTKKSTNQVKSTFFSGVSIAEKLNNSFFGYFTKIIKEYDIKTSNVNSLISELQLPKIIVIGAESSGKSSLLENITKCPIFPRNVNICTRLPIHFKLNTNSNKNIKCQITYQNITTEIDKDLIQDFIQNIMSKLLKTISFDEIVIELNDDSLPTFEFYDLPGIVAYPADISELTYKLCEKYICQKDVIILCVIPATITRITSYQPISLIKKYKKEQNTIICLTMSDRVQEENIEDLIIKRITKTTDEYNADEFAGTCAIMNRTHKDNIQLLDHDKNEFWWFKSNILDNIPEDYPEDLKVLIKNNITVGQLISNLDIIYNNYINTVWMPYTINKLNKNIDKINSEIEVLGIDPDLINKQELHDFYKDFTNIFLKEKLKICYEVKYLLKDSICFYSDEKNNYSDDNPSFISINKIEVSFEDIFDENIILYNYDFSKGNDNRKSIIQINNYKHGTITNSNCFVDSNDRRITIPRNYSNYDRIYYNVSSNVNIIYKFEEYNYEKKENKIYQIFKFNIKRFDNLTKKYVEYFNEYIIKKINICVTEMKTSIKWSFITDDLVTKLKLLINNCVDRYALDFFTENNNNNPKFNKLDEFINLKESDEYKKKRIDLNIKLYEMQQIIVKIKSYDDNVYEDIIES